MKIFRKIRFDVMNKSNTGKYLKYAIGEIILVVIGILIALQIGDWNEDYKNVKKEKENVINLQQDLKLDSIRLNEVKNGFTKAVKSKVIIVNILDGKNVSKDSLITHFSNQYSLINDFVPNSTTLDELKNSNGLNLISNSKLRRQIVVLSNSYDQLIIKLKLGSEKAQIALAYASKHVNDISAPTYNEVSTLLDDNYFKNQIRLNYLYTQLLSTEQAYKNCIETLALIRKELGHDKIL